MSEASVTRKAALWVGVIFLLGAALGGMLGYVFAHHTAMAAPTQMTETEKRAQKVQRLTQELNLAPDQQKQIEAIIASVQAQYHTPFTQISDGSRNPPVALARSPETRSWIVAKSRAFAPFRNSSKHISMVSAMFANPRSTARFRSRYSGLRAPANQRP